MYVCKESKRFSVVSAHDCVNGHAIKFVGPVQHTLALPPCWEGGVDINKCHCTTPTCWQAGGTSDNTRHKRSEDVCFQRV
jgi:hypothetical protein